jgi:nitrate reductase alpha subunit
MRADSGQDHAPQITVVERDYPNVYARFTALGPLMDKLGNGGKGIAWNTRPRSASWASSTAGVTARGVNQGMPKIDSSTSTPAKPSCSWRPRPTATWR